MRELTLMIKPASGLCNLACEYCFYRDLTQCRERASYGVMSRETLEAVVRRACREAEQGVNFIFQAVSYTHLCRGSPWRGECDF